jgi:hypothetical protein
MVGVHVESKGEAKWKTYAVVGWIAAAFFMLRVNLKEVMPENWELVCVACFMAWQYFKNRTKGYPATTDGVILATKHYLSKPEPVGKPLASNLTYESSQVRSVGSKRFIEIALGESWVVYGYDVAMDGHLLGPIDKIFNKNVDDVVRELETSKIHASWMKDKSLLDNSTFRAVADEAGVGLPGEAKDEEEQ